MLIEERDGNITPILPGFEVTVDFLDKWLEEYVEGFVINQIGIRIRHYDEWGNDERGI